MIRTTIVYNHRQRFNKNGTAPVEVRVTINRRAYYINTGVCVRPREWKFGQVEGCWNADELNKRIRIMLDRVDKIVNDRLAECSESEINFSELRAMVFASDNRRKLTDADDMVAWMIAEVDNLHVAKGTAAHYRCSVAALRESGIISKWSELKVENIHRFDAWLHNIKKRQTDAEVKAMKPAEYISQATVRNYHKDIKALISRAVKFGIISANPYDRMRGEIKRGDKESVEFLTKEELNRIEQLTLCDGSMLSAARDMFMFQAYTGMAYADMQSFRLDECRRDGERWILIKNRVKTGVTYYVQLLPQALAIAKHYGGELPKVAVQVYNRNLKRIAESTGITKRLTSHVARHTFATWALHEQVPLEIVSKILGHSKITQTQRYAKVIANDVCNQFDKLAKL